MMQEQDDFRDILDYVDRCRREWDQEDRATEEELRENPYALSQRFEAAMKEERRRARYLERRRSGR